MTESLFLAADTITLIALVAFLLAGYGLAERDIAPGTIAPASCSGRVPSSPSCFWLPSSAKALDRAPPCSNASSSTPRCPSTSNPSPPPDKSASPPPPTWWPSPPGLIPADPYPAVIVFGFLMAGHLLFVASFAPTQLEMILQSILAVGVTLASHAMTVRTFLTPPSSGTGSDQPQDSPSWEPYQKPASKKPCRAAGPGQCNGRVK